MTESTVSVDVPENVARAFLAWCEAQEGQPDESWEALVDVLREGVPDQRDPEDGPLTPERIAGLRRPIVGDRWPTA